MGYKKRTFVDDMVDVFGYDYVIGYCLCSEYNLKNLAGMEEDADKRSALIKKANRFANDASRLTRERFEYGL